MYLLYKYLPSGNIKIGLLVGFCTCSLSLKGKEKVGEMKLHFPHDFIHDWCGLKSLLLVKLTSGCEGSHKEYRQTPLLIRCPLRGRIVLKRV